MKLILTFGLMISSIIIFPGWVTGDEGSQHRFVKEYPIASARLRNFYTNMRMSAKETAFLHREQNNKIIQLGENVDDWEFCGNGDLLRLIIYPDLSGGRSRTASIAAIVLGSKQSFRLKKSARSDAYSIISMGETPPREYRNLIESFRLGASLDFAPYCALELDIDEFLKSNKFKINDEHEIITNDGKFIRVEWECREPALRGWFLFMADSWALREYEFYVVATKLRSGKVADLGRFGINDYAGEHGGIPLIRGMRTWTSGPLGKFPNMTAEVTKLVPGPVSEKEFTLAAFGIYTGAEPTSIPIAYYLLGLSALCGLTALALRFMRKRSSASP